MPLCGSPSGWPWRRGSEAAKSCLRVLRSPSNHSRDFYKPTVPSTLNRFSNRTKHTPLRVHTIGEPRRGPKLSRAVVGWLATALSRLSSLLAANQALSGASAATSRGWKYPGCTSPPGVNSPVLFLRCDFSFGISRCHVVHIYVFPFVFSNARTFSNAPSTVLFESLRFPQRFYN